MTTITRAGAEAIDRLRPLWLELHHHHQAIGGEALGPYVDGIRLYERRGFRPAWLYMFRLVGRWA